MIELLVAMGQPPGGEGGGGNPLLTFLPFILMIAVIYLLLIRPQRKRQQKQQEMIKSLVKGDRVVTQSGMFGTIVGVHEGENKVVLKIDDNTKVEFLRSSISGKVEK